MANTPTTNATRSSAPPPRFNETTIAIAGALVLAMVLTTIFIANPLRVMQLAYTDYSHTPAAPGVPIASDTRAPLDQNDKK